MNGFMKLSERLSRHFIFNVVRRGMTVLIPVVLVGSIAQAIISFPAPGFEEWITNVFGGVLFTILSYIRNFSFSYFSVMLSISISTSYVLEKSEPLEISVFAPPAACIAYLIIARIDMGGETVKLGTQGSFWALGISLIVTWAYLKLVHSRLGNVWNIAAGHDIFYRGAMRALLPLLVIIICTASLSYFIYDVCGIDNLTFWLGEHIDKVLNSLHSDFAELFASTFLIHLLWFFGIHGSNVLEPFMTAHTAVGTNIIFSKTFFDVFVIMGGCGTSVCILIAILAFSKHGKFKNLARYAALPVFLNINEMITFGLPIIWNPILLVPFMLVPLEGMVVAYFAIRFGLVAPVVSEVVWTTPIIFSGYFATKSISGAILQIVIVTLGTLTYIPFLKMHERFDESRVKTQVRKMTELLQESEVSGEDVTFLEHSDSLGVTANMLMNDLRTAVAGRQPYLVYQPQYTADGTCIGAEALLRWRHPTAGFIYPPLIIYLAKKGGFLPELETNIFDIACNALKQIEATVGAGNTYKVSVNITARSLKWEGLEDCIAEAVKRFDVEPGKLWIEITEQDLLSKDQENTKKIARLREKGHKFFIDDFGMGKTSIFYLQSMLFDGVKIDGSLIRTIIDDKTSREIVSSVIDLSGKLGMKVVAEFVETKEICELLDKFGCDYYQGYYFSKPIGLSEFLKRLEK